MPRYVLDLRTATDHFPGVGRYAFNLARAMAPLLAEDEHLVVMHDPAGAPDSDLEELQRSDVELAGLRVSPFSARQHRAVVQLVRRYRGDLYHSPHWAVAYPGRAKAVVTIHDLIPLLYPQCVSVQARLYFRFVMSLVPRLAARAIAVSERTRRDLVAHFDLPASRTTTIPLAADPAFRPQTGDSVVRCRQRLRLGDGYVLYVGSNKPHKNLVRLVEAWAAVQPQSVPLVIAGPWDPRYPEARARTAELQLGEAVRFVGRVPEQDMPALYAGALLLVLPSEYEGFGLPALEAMACGTPVACAGAGALPEVVGDDALTFDPLDVGAMGRTLARAAGDAPLRRKLSERGRERAKCFSWRRTASATLDVYREALSSGENTARLQGL